MTQMECIVRPMKNRSVDEVSWSIGLTLENWEDLNGIMNNRAASELIVVLLLVVRGRWGSAKKRTLYISHMVQARGAGIFFVTPPLSSVYAHMHNIRHRHPPGFLSDFQCDGMQTDGQSIRKTTEGFSLVCITVVWGEGG